MDFGAELRDHNNNNNQMSFEDSEVKDVERKASYALSQKINESEAVSQNVVRDIEQNQEDDEVPYGIQLLPSK